MQASAKLVEPLAASVKCGLCRADCGEPARNNVIYMGDDEDSYHATKVVHGRSYHGTCWSTLDHALKKIPPFYRSVRPITPERFNDKPFLVLLGGCGLGKSVTAAECVEFTSASLGLIAKWSNVTELLKDIRGTFGNHHSERNEKKIVDDHCEANLLCLDDLASEKTSEFSTSTLCMILNARGEYGRKTVITSNLSLNEIATKLDDRIASRLHRYGQVITLSKNNVRTVAPAIVSETVQAMIAETPKEVF